MAPEISIAAEKLFSIGWFPVTNSLLLSWVTVLILLIIGLLLRAKLSLLPGKLQGIFEALFEEMLSLMDNVLGSRAKSERYLPIVATVFLFVLVSNWFEVIPGLGSVFFKGMHEGEHALIPILRSPSADLNFTIALAVIVMFSVQLLGVLAVGVKRYSHKFFNFSNPIVAFAGLLELISEFVKIISFSFRLFGNIFAGEVLLLIVGFLLPFAVPLPFLFLEVFVGFIQAFIFSMLTMVFIAMAVAEEGH